MSLIFNGIYLADATMWFNMAISNKSLIDYTPEIIRFYIRDRRLSSRTAIQENRLEPLYAHPPFKVKGNESMNFVYGFSAFTIPKDKELVIQVTELNGSRFLALHVKSRTILKAHLMF